MNEKKRALLLPRGIPLVPRRTIDPVTAEASACILAHLVGVSAGTAGRTLVDVCGKHTREKLQLVRISRTWRDRDRTGECRDCAERSRRLHQGRAVTQVMPQFAGKRVKYKPGAPPCGIK